MPRRLFSSCSERGLLAGCGRWARKLRCMGLVAPHMGSSQTRDRTWVSCIGRQILYLWPTEEALLDYIWREANCVQQGIWNMDWNLRKRIGASWRFGSPLYLRWGFPCNSVGKESAYSEGDRGSIPGSGRSPGEGNGNRLQYSCLENRMDRGAWRATVHGLQQSDTT